MSHGKLPTTQVGIIILDGVEIEALPMTMKSGPTIQEAFGEDPRESVARETAAARSLVVGDTRGFWWKGWDGSAMSENDEAGE